MTEFYCYYSVADRRWVAVVPHLPGCMADGATPAEAATVIQEVAALWIETAEAEGREVPAALVRLGEAEAEITARARDLLTRLPRG